MARRGVSYCQARALSRKATPECEEELLEVARRTTVAHLERVVRQWDWICGGDEQELERARWDSRRLAVAPDDGGMYVIRGRVGRSTR